MNLTKEEYEKLQIERPELLIVQYIIESGFAGILPGSGTIVDRRIYEEAIAIPRSKVFDNPEPIEFDLSDPTEKPVFAKEFKLGMKVVDEPKPECMEFLIIDDPITKTIKEGIIFVDPIGVSEEETFASVFSYDYVTGITSVYCEGEEELGFKVENKNDAPTTGDFRPKEATYTAFGEHVKTWKINQEELPIKKDDEPTGM